MSTKNLQIRYVILYRLQKTSVHDYLQLFVLDNNGDPVRDADGNLIKVNYDNDAWPHELPSEQDG